MTPPDGAAVEGRPAAGPVPWRAATAAALYGPAGFFRRSAPADHFRTSVTASPQLAEALGRLASEVDALLGHPDPFLLVDLGAGRGELLRTLAGAAPERWRLVAVEVAARPPDLPRRVAWREDLPRGGAGLLLAHELLDDVPVDVVERTPDGLGLVLVDPASGTETPGGPPSAADAAWLARWWPLADGERGEPGVPRDAVWVDAVASLARGVAVAVDYATARDDRAAGRYPRGTLAGYRGGRQVPPVPDGSCDVTAHVALDACAAAGTAAGATATLLSRQREVLTALGVHGTAPDPRGARADPAGHLAALQRASEAAELRDPAGLGGFGWLVQAVGCPLPPSLAPLAGSGP